MNYSEKGGGNSTDYEEFIICTQLHSHSNRSLLLRGPPQPACPSTFDNFDNYNINYCKNLNKLRDTTLLTIFVDLYKQNNSNGRATL